MLLVQVAVDCADPHRLARFWSEALGMEIEDHHDQIEELLTEGHATEADTVTMDGRRAWRTAAACRDPQGRLPRLLFQVVPEPKTVKNRVHLDVHVGPEERDAKVAELEAAGASRLWEAQQGPHSWVTLADPEGNEFCVS
jgi:predicted enzyme related to lactoylglutathione lyase